MSIIYKKYSLRSFYEEDFLNPQNEYCALFGWINVYGKPYVEDNTWEEEYWDGDGYSTRTHGTMDKYYPIYSFTFTELKKQSFVEIQAKTLREIPDQYKQLPPPQEPSQEKKRLASVRGEYRELIDDWLERLRTTGEKNAANRANAMVAYNGVFQDMVPLIYPLAQALPDYPIKNEYDPKQYKAYMKAAKKLKKVIDEINSIRAARAFANCTNSEILALPEEIQNYLMSCYKRYKNSNFRDDAWEG